MGLLPPPGGLLAPTATTESATNEQLLEIVNELQKAADELDSWQLGGIVDTPALLCMEIALVLEVPRPAGAPAKIEALANEYLSVSEFCYHAAEDLAGVAEDSLPAAWRGAAAESASAAAGALYAGLQVSGAVFSEGHQALHTFAAALVAVQRRDNQGIAQLRDALAQLPLLSTGFEISDVVGPLYLAQQGCGDRLAAARKHVDAVSDLTIAMVQYAADARAQLVNAPGVDPLSAVILAYTANSKVDPGMVGNISAYGILSPTGLERASQRLDAMSAADRAAFEKMLAASGSTQEAAYLWKALAAGYSLSDVQAFDKVIQPHGSDTAWLMQHLDPQVTNLGDSLGLPGQQAGLYDGKSIVNVPAAKTPQDKDYWTGTAYPDNVYDQGRIGDCVSAATVVARAANDPVLMLGLTTGEGPAAVAGAKAGDDSVTAFRARLQTEYQATYAVENKSGYAAVYNTTLTPVTGDSYQSGVSISTTAERAAQLPKIEADVAAGKPVLMGVQTTNGNAGHALVILGAQGDQLEVYNPWGFTEWISTKQFLTGQVGALTSSDGSATGGLPDDTTLALPE